MQRSAVATVVGLLIVFLSRASLAQTPPAPATQRGFSFCTVHDTEGRTLWASPVFEVEYLSSDPLSRTQEMATDFHNFIGGMGGAGDKQCASATADRAEVDAFRNEQHSILTQRFMGVVRSNRWLDVAWTPKPWTPALMVKPAVASKHFYCYGTDTDQRDTTASTVASPVFEMSMDGADPSVAYELAEEYNKEFSRYVVEVHGLTRANPSCYFKDTRAEAEKALRDYRKMFGGFNTKFADVAWRPTGGAVAPAAASGIGSKPPSVPVAAPRAQGRIGVGVAEVTSALAVGLGMDKAHGALVIEVQPGSPAMAAGLKPMDVVLSVNGQAIDVSTDLPVISSRLTAGVPASLRVWRQRAEIEVQVDVAGQPVAVVAQAGVGIAAPATVATVPPVAVTGSRKYCHAFIQFIGKPGGVHSNVWENSGSDGGQAAMTATLATFVVHMRNLQPKTWHDFTASPVQCDTNSGFCYASVLRHFGTSQLAGQFCKATRQEAETDWARLANGDPTMAGVGWPAAR